MVEGTHGGRGNPGLVVVVPSSLMAVTVVVVTPGGDEGRCHVMVILGAATTSHSATPHKTACDMFKGVIHPKFKKLGVTTAILIGDPRSTTIPKSLTHPVPVSPVRKSLLEGASPSS